MNANGSGGGVSLPPIDPGNTFVLLRPRPDVLALDGDDVELPADGVLSVAVTTVRGAADPMWQTIHPATMNDGTKVGVVTWRVGPGTLTARLTREDMVKLGRAMIEAGRSSTSALLITGPQADVELQVVLLRCELDGCAVAMRWASEDCRTLGGALVRSAQDMSGLVVPGPGIHPGAS